MSAFIRNSPLPRGLFLARAGTSMGGGNIDAGPLPDDVPDGSEMASNLETIIGSVGRVRQSLIAITEAQKKLAQTSSAEHDHVIEALSGGVDEIDAAKGQMMGAMEALKPIHFHF